VCRRQDCQKIVTGYQCQSLVEYEDAAAESVSMFKMMLLLQLRKPGFCHIYNDWCNVKVRVAKWICQRQTRTKSPDKIVCDVGAEWVTFWKNIL
jgi:hypothetical protein